MSVNRTHSNSACSHQRSPWSKRLPLVTFILVFFLATGYVLSVGSLERPFETPTFQWAAPLFDAVISVGLRVERWIAPRYRMLGGILATLVWGTGILLIRGSDRGAWQSRLFLAGCGGIILGQGFNLAGEPAAGFTIMVISGAVGFLSVRQDDARPATMRAYSPPHFDWRECAALTFLLSLALVNRMYLLNHIPGGWDDEGCFPRLVSTDFWNVVAIGIGSIEPTSSLGVIWGVIHHAAGELINYSLMTTRVVGVVLSILVVLLFYWGTRSTIGPLPAWFAAGWFLFDPLQIGWARETFYHHLPQLVLLPIVFCTLQVLRTKRTRYFLGLFVLMPISALLYPPGILSALIPVIAIPLDMTLHFSTWRSHFAKISLVLAGLVGWALMKPLLWLLTTGTFKLVGPFMTHIPSVRDSMNEDTTFIEMAVLLGAHWIGNLPEIFRIIFLRTDTPTHWSFLSTFAPNTAVSGAVAALSVVGGIILLSGWRAPLTVTIVSALPTILLPALSSYVADRRIGPLFPLLILLAAVGLQEIWNRLAGPRNRLRRWGFAVVAVLILGGICISQTTSYFRRLARPPHVMKVAEAIESELESPTLLVPVVDERWQCHLANALVDVTMRGTPLVGWAFNTLPKAQGELPQPMVDSSFWFYQLTAMKRQLSRVATTPWERVYYIFCQKGPPAPLEDAVNRLSVRKKLLNPRDPEGECVLYDVPPESVLRSTP